MSKVSLTINSEINEVFAKTEVLQEFTNTTDNPLELRIYVYKKTGILFDSFKAKIGDSIEVKSKVIKTEKAETKYTDSIASGNAAIFVKEDPDNKNRYIINMGNIPAKEKVIFKSKFIHFTEFNKRYEFELFRNLPIFQGKNRYTNYENSDLKGTINIKANHPILNLEKEIIMKNLIITEEKYIDKDKKNYLINYEIKNLPSFDRYNLDYIPCSKIYFDFNIDYPIIYVQDSTIDINEKNYYIKYKYKNETNSEKIDIENYPSLFIFLVDQSGSMSGSAIQLASNALKLFMQSLPEGSYFQIIGFGSHYKKYDEQPKEYNKENIDTALKKIEKLKADLGGTDIYEPLKNIFDSYKIYEKINLPKNIFILTDGEVDNKEQVIEIIGQNNDKFKIYSIGIGNYFDKDLIKTTGTMGKGGYNFCKNLNALNSSVITLLKSSVIPYISNLETNSILKEKNTLKKNLEDTNSIMKESELFCPYYILNKEEGDKIKNIKLDIKYIDNKKNEVKNNYDIIPNEIQKGEELSKLIINDYIKKNTDLDEEQKIQLSIKYQILTKYTSLFTDIEFSDKIQEEMKLQILGNKNSNIEYHNEDYKPRYREKFCCCCCRNDDADEDSCSDGADDDEMDCDDDEDGDEGSGGGYGFHSFRINNYYENEKREKERIKKEEEERKKKEEEERKKKEEEEGEKEERKRKEEERKRIEEEKLKMKKIEDDKNIILNENKIVIKELSDKKDIMKIISTQDFIKGYWEENEYTKIIKEKYNKQYELLKALKDLNINDKAAISVLIVLFIYSEHQELLDELFMIIKKAKIFIKNETGESYENIIKKISIN